MAQRASPVAAWPHQVHGCVLPAMRLLFQELADSVRAVADLVDRTL